MSAIAGVPTSTIQIHTNNQIAEATAAPGKAPAKVTASGDVVSISKEGKELSEASKGKETTNGKTATDATSLITSTAKLTETVQNTKSQIQSLKSKLDAEKNQAGSSDDVKQLDARINDLNTTLAKEKAKLYA